MIINTLNYRFLLIYFLFFISILISGQDTIPALIQLIETNKIPAINRIEDVGPKKSVFRNGKTTLKDGTIFTIKINQK